MSIMDWLRKLGILRRGAVKASYRGGRERPEEFMMDNVFDADKDLLRKGPPGPKPPPEAK